VFKIKIKSKYLAIAILVGGKSTRFGSDKGLFKFRGKPLISYQIETLSQLNYEIFIVTHSIKQTQNYLRNIDISKITAFVIDNREMNDDKAIHTPMIGLYSIFLELKNLKYQRVLTLSCDLPLVSKNVINYLIEQSKGFECCIPQWDNGFLEPLIAIYPVKKALYMAKKNIEKKAYKLTNLISPKWKTNFVSIEQDLKSLDKNLLTFTNINEQSDLNKLEDITLDL
jgi:molybdopterin-guanine dinucleotide biosynthesis protein A